MSDYVDPTATHAEDGAAPALDKGKGKAAEPADMSMDEDESSEEDSGPEEQGEPEGEDEDNMEEIDTENIISDGRRTRGKTIDFVKAAENEDVDDDEDDDEDFEDPDEMEQ